MSLSAIVGQAKADPTAQRTLQFSSSFEESGRDTSERYIWRNSQSEASLNVGGRLSIRTSSGSEAHISFPGGNVRSEPHGEVPSEIAVMYYVGAPKDWRTPSHFERVRYSAIYPGIDLVFLVTRGQLEYTFEISPYANPREIRVLLEGASGYLTPGGDLKLNVTGPTITQRRPVAYQAAIIISGVER